jgi:hypothetical protein
VSVRRAQRVHIAALTREVRVAHEKLLDMLARASVPPSVSYCAVHIFQRLRHLHGVASSERDHTTLTEEQQRNRHNKYQVRWVGLVCLWMLPRSNAGGDGADRRLQYRMAESLSLSG